MAFGDQDTDIFFADGTAVTLSDGSTLMAHFDLPERIDSFPGMGHISAAAVAGDPHITFATTRKPAGFGRNTQVMINGKKYRVREVVAESDGLVSVAHLTEV